MTQHCLSGCHWNLHCGGHLYCLSVFFLLCSYCSSALCFGKTAEEFQSTQFVLVFLLFAVVLLLIAEGHCDTFKPHSSVHNNVSLQGGESRPSQRTGWTVWVLLSEMSGAEPSGAKQRWEGTGDLPQGERLGTAEERKPGELSASANERLEYGVITGCLLCTCAPFPAGLKGPPKRWDESCAVCTRRSAFRGQQRQDLLWTGGNRPYIWTHMPWK